MKILFADTKPSVPASYGDLSATGSSTPDVRLSRNEVVALLNVLHRLSMSLSAIHVMRDLEAQQALHGMLIRGLATAGAILVALMLLRWRLAPKRRKIAPSSSKADGLGVKASPASDSASSSFSDGDGVPSGSPGAGAVAQPPHAPVGKPAPAAASADAQDHDEDGYDGSHDDTSMGAGPARRAARRRRA